jgi:hypothetical protein
MVYEDVYKELDNLKPGTYKIKLSKCIDPSEFCVIRNVTLYPDKLTELTLELRADVKNELIDTATIIKEKEEMQYQLSVLNGDWLQKNSILKFCGTFRITYFKWFAFSKHVGFLGGFGLGLGYYTFSKDTTFMNLIAGRKTSEFYNYIDGHVDVKFRFSLKSQQDGYYTRALPFIDIGMMYNAPLSFRHVAYYENDKRAFNGKLHQFTDARAYVNIGFAPVSLFAEYRVFDFIIGSYPELPRYNFGIRIIPDLTAGKSNTTK